MLIKSYMDLAEWRDRQTNSKIVVASGCFDVLHVGHLRYLEFSKHHGSCLLVGINSDDSVRSIKGSSRPINRQLERAEMLSALRIVDAVFIFDETTATRFLELAKPHVWVKGSDYNAETLNQDERKAVESSGGTIAFCQVVPGKSSTVIIQQL